MVNNKRCNPSLTDDYINRILAYLHGWVLQRKHKVSDEYSTAFLNNEEIPDAMETIQTISRAEVKLFFDKGKTEVMSFLWFDYIPAVAPVHEALCKWTAGLIWKKYNVKEVDLLDGTNQVGYGDQLIGQAKRELQPYIRKRLRSIL